MERRYIDTPVDPEALISTTALPTSPQHNVEEKPRMLSKLERLMLLNQYEILEQTGDGATYTRQKEILVNGYEAEYESLFRYLDDDMPREVGSFVQDVLMMYEALQRGYTDNGPEKPVPNELQFNGFDGNGEADYLGYWRFVTNVEGRWGYIRGPEANDGNSHMPMVEVYSRMLRKWKELGSPQRLSQEQVQAVAAERIHPDNR